MTGTGPQTITLSPSDLPVSPVNRVEISFDAPGNFTASGLKAEACVEYPGKYHQLVIEKKQ